MKEQIIAILGKNIKCTDERGSLTGFNECADEIIALFQAKMPSEEEQRLKFLEERVSRFNLHSDMSCFCNGYRVMVDELKELRNRIKGGE